MKVLVSVYATTSRMEEPTATHARGLDLLDSFIFESNSFREPIIFEVLARVSSDTKRFLIVVEGKDQLSSFFYERKIKYD